MANSPEGTIRLTNPYRSAARGARELYTQTRDSTAGRMFSNKQTFSIHCFLDINNGGNWTQREVKEASRSVNRMFS